MHTLHCYFKPAQREHYIYAVSSLPVVNPVESLKTLIYGYQLYSQFYPVDAVMRQAKYIRFRLCSCLYLYLFSIFCLCFRDFPVFVPLAAI